MTGGLTSVSEAQHRELVTGGDAFGTEGVVEDVTGYVDFGTDHAAPESAVEQAQEATASDESSGTDSTSRSGFDLPTKGAAVAALAIGALAARGGS